MDISPLLNFLRWSESWWNADNSFQHLYSLLSYKITKFLGQRLLFLILVFLWFVYTEKCAPEHVSIVSWLCLDFMLSPLLFFSSLLYLFIFLLLIYFLSPPLFSSHSQLRLLLSPSCIGTLRSWLMARSSWTDLLVWHKDEDWTTTWLHWTPNINISQYSQYQFLCFSPDSLSSSDIWSLLFSPLFTEATCLLARSAFF